MNKTILLGIVAFLGTLDAMAAQIESKPQALQVEVLVFSGRPNPVFLVTDAKEIDELLALAESLPSASAAEFAPIDTPRLGYRGLLVENVSGVRPDIESVRLFRSCVQISKLPQSAGKAAAASAPAPKQVRKDVSSALEHKLLQLARKRGAIDDALLAYMIEKR